MERPTALFRKINQICPLVTDLRKSMDACVDHLNIGPWLQTETSSKNASNAQYRGSPISWPTMFPAICMRDDIQFEVIQVMDKPNPTVFSDFLETAGPGIHHLGIFTHPSYKETLAHLTRAGRPVIQSALFDGREPCAFVDFRDTIGVFLEFNDRGAHSEDFGPPPFTGHWPVEEDGSHVYPTPFTLDRPFISKITTIGFVVKDLEAAIRDWYDICGVGPWAVIEQNEHNISDVTVNGSPGRVHALLGVCKYFPGITLKVYQPLAEDDSTFSRFLQEKGSGIHHICAETSAGFEDSLTHLAQLTGFSCPEKGQLQTVEGVLKSAYVDTTEQIGVMLCVDSDPTGPIPAAKFRGFYPPDLTAEEKQGFIH